MENEKDTNGTSMVYANLEKAGAHDSEVVLEKKGIGFSHMPKEEQ